VIHSLGALGFWIFIAAVVVAGIWGDARKKEIQQETLRRIVESGKEIDAAVIDKVLATDGDDANMEQELTTAGLIVIFVAPGLATLGWFLSALNEKLLTVMLGVSFLVGFVGVGLLVAGRFAKRGNLENKG
jgi:hypothetical protein